MAIKLPPLPVMYGVGGLIAAAVVGWLVTRALDKLSVPGAPGALGAAVGGGAVDLVSGVVGGVNDALGIPRTSDVVGWANSDSNPLQPAGAWIGGKLYDLTHWGQ